MLKKRKFNVNSSSWNLDFQDLNAKFPKIFNLESESTFDNDDDFILIKILYQLWFEKYIPLFLIKNLNIFHKLNFMQLIINRVILSSLIQKKFQIKQKFHRYHLISLKNFKKEFYFLNNLSTDSKTFKCFKRTEEFKKFIIIRAFKFLLKEYFKYQCQKILLIHKNIKLEFESFDNPKSTFQGEILIIRLYLSNAQIFQKFEQAINKGPDLRAD